MPTILLNQSDNLHLILYLLKEELKMARFFNDLDDAGLENRSRFQLNLSPLIQHYIGLDDSDATIERYVQLLDAHAEAIDAANYDTIADEALAFYHELVAMKNHTR